jgi:hypothetical protein
MGKALTKMIQIGQLRSSGTLVGYILILYIRDRRVFAEPIVVFQVPRPGLRGN